ncbi:MAG: tetratricopeptide repeat protein [Muribaculaceae bacterium]|nr:tetratricopeptide repeat protein [Muribaculaceae bacterium]
MKQVIITLLLTVIALPILAGNTNIDRANQAYKQELYNEALKLYLQEAEKTGVSSSLYCNIGDTYYRLKDNVHAVLYYERALLLDPSNGDARFNLEFVRGKMQLPDDAGDSWFSNWVDQTVSRLSSNAWAIIAIVTFLLFLAGVAAYLFLDNVLMRKIGFFGGGVLIVLSILANLAAFHVHDKATSGNGAIVMPQSVVLSTAPREPRDKQEEAFQLQQGTRVEIVDSIADKTSGKWLQVSTAGGHKAWIKAQDVEVI